MSEAPKQVTEPGSASKGYSTSGDGKIYPEENTRAITEYAKKEGSISFEHNQGVVREGFKPPKAEYNDMGQDKLPTLKATGSFAI